MVMGELNARFDGDDPAVSGHLQVIYTAERME